MATDSDKIISVCPRCGGVPIVPYLERQQIRVQVNGLGGIWPNAILRAGDIVEIAFRKNGGAWNLLPRQYEIKNSATPPNTLVLYTTFKLEETNFGTQE